MSGFFQRLDEVKPLFARITKKQYRSLQVSVGTINKSNGGTNAPKSLHFNVTHHPASDRVFQTARSVSRAWSVSVCHPRPRLEVRCRCNQRPESDGPYAEAHECSGALAERDCGALDRKLSPEGPRRHRAGRTTFAWLLPDYVNYNHDDRIHDSLSKHTQTRRAP